MARPAQGGALINTGRSNSDVCMFVLPPMRSATTEAEGRDGAGAPEGEREGGEETEPESPREREGEEGEAGEEGEEREERRRGERERKEREGTGEEKRERRKGGKGGKGGKGSGQPPGTPKRRPKATVINRTTLATR